MRATQLSREIFASFLHVSQPKEDQSLARAGRIEHLRLALAVPLGENVTAKRFGELVAAMEGRKPYDKATPTRWEDGASPSVEALEAMSRLAQKHGLRYVSRAWLAFGPAGVNEATNAPAAPEIQPKRRDVPLIGTKGYKAAPGKGRAKKRKTASG